MNKYPIYPKYEMVVRYYSDSLSVKLFSSIRKKHTDGNWYFIDCVNQVSGSAESAEPTTKECFDNFIDNCYKAILFSEINPDLEGFYKKDTRQEDEWTRLGMKKHNHG